MSYVSAGLDQMITAASDLANLGSIVSAANSAAAGPSTNLLAAAADEVSEAIAGIFNSHAQSYQSLSSRAEQFHQQFVQLLNSAAGQYTSTEAAAVNPLQTLEQGLLNAVNAPSVALTGRPLIGDGANGAPGTGANGGDAGWLVGNGGAGGSGWT
ncbi:PE family protein, partial [Mycobacterium kiyosense]